jgi:hypothetical protein
LSTSWGEGPAGGSGIAGCFLLVMGLCLALLGGGCTLSMIGSLVSWHHGLASLPGIMIGLLIPLAMLLCGVALIRAGLRRIG